MNLLAPVSDIMTKNLIIVSPQDTIKKVESIFENNRIHHLPVEKGGKLIGMISKSDYLYFKRGFNENNVEHKWDSFRLKTHVVSEIMTTKLASLQKDEKINVALEIFKENIFHAIPVLDKERLVGMVTTHDIIARIAESEELKKVYK